MNRQSTPFTRFWNEFRENRIAVLALCIVVLMAAGTFASFVSPQNPYDLANLSLMDSRRPGFVGTGGSPIGWELITGTDLLSAIFYGLRISIQIGLAAVLFRSVSEPHWVFWLLISAAVWKGPSFGWSTSNYPFRNPAGAGDRGIAWAGQGAIDQRAGCCAIRLFRPHSIWQPKPSEARITLRPLSPPLGSHLVILTSAAELHTAADRCGNSADCQLHFT